MRNEELGMNGTPEKYLILEDPEYANGFYSRIEGRIPNFTLILRCLSSRSPETAGHIGKLKTHRSLLHHLPHHVVLLQELVDLVGACSAADRDAPFA